MPVEHRQPRRGRDRLVGHLDDQLADAAHQLRLHVAQLGRFAGDQHPASPSGSARRPATASRARSCGARALRHLPCSDDDPFWDNIWYWQTPEATCVDGRTDVQCKDFDDWSACLAGAQGLTPAEPPVFEINERGPGRLAGSGHVQSSATLERRRTVGRSAAAAPFLVRRRLRSGSIGTRGFGSRCCWACRSSRWSLIYFGSLVDPVPQRVLEPRHVHRPRRPRIHARELPELAGRCSWTVVLRTVGMAAVVTVTCAVIAFPIAYYMARVASPRMRGDTRRRRAHAALGELPDQGLLVEAHPAEEGVLNWFARAARPDGPRLRRGRPCGSSSHTCGCRT